MEKLATFGLVLLGLFCTSTASPLLQRDSELCGMAQFECDMVQTLGQLPKGDGKPGLQRVKLNFDATNKRMKLVTSKTDIEGKETKYDVFLAPEMMHIFSAEAGWCVKQQRTTRIEACLPKGAEISGRRGYGSEKAPLNAVVLNYRLVVPGVSDLQIEEVVSIQEPSAPITEVAIGKMRGEPYMRSGQFYDVTEGIKDSSVFDLPTACINAPEGLDEQLINEITDKIPFQ